MNCFSRAKTKNMQLLNLYKNDDIKYLCHLYDGMTIEQHIANNKKLSDQQKNELIKLISYHPVKIVNNNIEINDETYKNIHLVCKYKSSKIINEIFGYISDVKYLSCRYNDMTIKDCINANTTLSSGEKEVLIQKIEEIEFDKFFE